MRLSLKICFLLVAVLFCLTPATGQREDTPPEKISFHLAGGQDPLIVVPVYVEGKGPYEFILDTGAFRCLLSPELSAAIGVRPEGQQEATGVGGSIRMSSARVTSLAIGSAWQANVEVAITEELSRFGDAISYKSDGVLGFNFLKNFRLSLDYQHDVLRLTRPSPEPREQNGLQLASPTSFRLAAPSMPLILLPVLVNGRGPFQFVLDTGASRTTLSFELARKLGIVAIGDRPGTGGGGQVRILSGTVDSLAVGKTSVRDLSVAVGEFLSILSKAAGTKLDGIVGDDFLSQFEVTIDYPHNTLDLKPLLTR